jgi:hypothetical protein
MSMPVVLNEPNVDHENYFRQDPVIDTPGLVLNASPKWGLEVLFQSKPSFWLCLKENLSKNAAFNNLSIHVYVIDD